MNRSVYKLVICLFYLIIVSFISLATSYFPAYAASSQAASPTLPTNCAIITTFLHGHQPATFICQKSKAHNSLSPYTNSENCTIASLRGDPTVELDATNGTTYCFVNTGYLGVPIIQHIDAVANGTSDRSWIVYYQNGHPGGHKLILNVGSGLYVFSPAIGVTQICIKC